MSIPNRPPSPFAQPSPATPPPLSTPFPPPAACLVFLRPPLCSRTPVSAVVSLSAPSPAACLVFLRPPLLSRTPVSAVVYPSPTAVSPPTARTHGSPPTGAVTGESCLPHPFACHTF